VSWEPGLRWRLIPAGQNESKKSRNMLCMPVGVRRLHLTVGQGNKIGCTGQPKVSLQLSQRP
jgi:hypothetical protein